MAMGLRFLKVAPKGSRLYFKARVAYLHSPEDLQTLLSWMSSHERFKHLLPASTARESLLTEFRREYPLPFLGSQRLVLSSGRVTLDLAVAPALSQTLGSTAAASLAACRIHFLHTINAPRVAVLGSGLAGCNLAAALANRGARVAIFERRPQPHTGASGNRQGALYIKPALAWSRENRLHVLSYQYAHRFYQRHFAGAKTEVRLQPWRHCGVLHLAQNEREQRRMYQLHEQALYPPQFIRPLTGEEATGLAGAPVGWPASAMSHGGMLEPARLCQELLWSHGIEVSPMQILRHADWDAVVWAGGHPQADDPLAPLSLPLRPIRGQISSVFLPDVCSEIFRAAPRQVLSGDGYVMPALPTQEGGGWLTFGASYAVNRYDTAICEKEMDDNSRQLARTLPDLARHIDDGDFQRVERAAVRCASTDYMPVVGRARLAHLQTERLPLRDKALAEALCTDERLWFMTSFGSKGLALTPLLAEQLACSILLEPLPLELDLSAGCCPDRWEIRAAQKPILPRPSILAEAGSRG